jgi:hypothetical protein
MVGLCFRILFGHHGHESTSYCIGASSRRHPIHRPSAFLRDSLRRNGQETGDFMSTELDDALRLAKEGGPWWTPTLVVQRLMARCKARDNDGSLIEVEARMLEGLCWDFLKWREENGQKQLAKLAGDSPAPECPVLGDDNIGEPQ